MAGDDDEVFDGTVVFVFGNVGGIVSVARELTDCGRVPSKLNVLSEERVDVFDDVPDDVTSAWGFANCLSFTRPFVIIVAVLEYTSASDDRIKKSFISNSSIIIHIVSLYELRSEPSEFHENLTNLILTVDISLACSLATKVAA